MADKIDRPGLYALSREAYHGSPIVEPSLSSSGAVTLVQECPAVFWTNSPLNPDFVPEQKFEFDIGSAAHLIILEPAQWGSQVVEIDADNYKTKAAQEARDAAYAAGKTPLLPKHRRTILAMLTPAGYDLLAKVTADLADAGFGLTGVDDKLAARVTGVLRQVRGRIGDIG